MNPRTEVPPKERVLHADADLIDLLTMLLRNASRRQMWLLFIDEKGRLGDPLIPMDDYPEGPDELTTVDDLGEVTNAHLYMHRMRLFLEAIGHCAIVLVWERVGGRQPTAADRQWAAAMAHQARVFGVPVRAQFVLHDKGLRQLYADDYVTAEVSV